MSHVFHSTPRVRKENQEPKVDLYQRLKQEAVYSRPAHLMVGREQIKVPQDLRRRGAWGTAHSFDITPLHLSHGFRGDLYFGNHCKKWANSKTNHLTATLRRFAPQIYFCLCVDLSFLNIQYQMPSVACFSVVSHYHSLVGWAWRRPVALLCRLCISGLDCQLLPGASVWSTSSHKRNPEGFRTGGA